MRINNNFAIANNPQKKNCHCNSTPSFGHITEEADEFIKLVLPDFEKDIGKRILTFIKNQDGVVLNYKAGSSPSFRLNWTSEKYVPERRKISINVFNAGGFEFKLSSETSIEKFKEFLDVSKPMVVYSLQAKISSLTRTAEKHRLTSQQDLALNGMKSAVDEIIKSCSHEEYNLMRNNFAKLAEKVGSQ